MTDPTASRQSGLVPITKRTTLHYTLLVGIGLAFAQIAAAQLATNEMRMFKTKPTFRANLKQAAKIISQPDAAYLAELRNDDSPSGNWGGPDCSLAADLLAMLDNYLATPNPHREHNATTVRCTQPTPTFS